MELIRYKEAARLAGIGERTLRQAVYDGRLTAYRIGGVVRLDRRDVEAWIFSQRRGPSIPKQPQATEAGR